MFTKKEKPPTYLMRARKKVHYKSKNVRLIKNSLRPCSNKKGRHCKKLFSCTKPRMKSYIFVAILVTLFSLGVQSISFNDLLKDEWDAFKSTYTKSYMNKVEEEFRMKVYLSNRRMIAKHNRNSKSNFKLKINSFGDLTPQEFKFRMNGYRMDLIKNKTDGKRMTFLSPQNFKAPTEVDWRQKGLVTPVKNQGQCGSCWAFSATGSLEGQHMRKTGQLVSLSEQNLIDCSRPEGNQGCNGGIMDEAFQYVIDSGGIDTEQSYPYEAHDDVCRFSRNNVGATDIAITDIQRGNEQALMEAVASVGPISVAIDASHDSFRMYSSGVHYDPNCSSVELDHGVLVVGYGTENGVDYWLVKNSWGEEWGDNGYIKMARNANNNCGIATQASYPVV